MKKKRVLLTTILSVAALAACAKQPAPSIAPEEPDKPLEIGDTVKEWSSSKDLIELPMGVQQGKGTGSITKDFGNTDSESLLYALTGNGYIDSGLINEPYFIDEDAKNGDIISLYYYLPANNNIKTLQLQALTSNSRSNPISGETITVDETKEEQWNRLVVSFDTLEMLGSIRVNYTLKDATQEASLYLDDVNITLGAETVKTGYEYNDESLYETYEDYFKIGTCISGSQIRNTEYRKIVKNDFNSITCENEGKPEQILDQAACQELARNDNREVAITVEPFEKIYDFAEANHIGVRHHTFVWYSQTPAWFFTEDYTQNGKKAGRDLMLARMENYIKTTIETINDRWPGLVYAIDVANEAVENGTYRTNNNNWYSTVGSDFITYAFQYASEVKAEGQELYYNDYSFDYETRNCQFALNTLLKDAIANGYIDGVGIQGHLDSNANLENVMTDAKMIKEKGLKCQITELDITINGTDQNNIKKQADAYKNFTIKMLENNEQGLTDINALIVWGIRDNESWKRNQNPLLFDDNYAKKPAYYGVLNAINEAKIERNTVEADE